MKMKHVSQLSIVEAGKKIYKNLKKFIKKSLDYQPWLNGYI